jgi:hypothetical protein
MRLFLVVIAAARVVAAQPMTEESRQLFLGFFEAGGDVLQACNGCKINQNTG